MQFPRIGVLGGGQLGKMLALAAGPAHLPIDLMDASEDFPAAPYAHRFVTGNFKDYDDVYNFGKTVDVLTIEIEHVNTEALHQLVKEGVTVHPSPRALDIIKDKGLQKQFYAEHGIPSSDFVLYPDADALKAAVASGERSLPFVQKSRTAGYDGRGVSVIKTAEDLEDKLLPGPCVAEDLVAIDKELAVIAARNEKGEVRTFPAVEMIFNPVANLVEFLSCPAKVSQVVEEQADQLARRVIEAYDLCGLLAVELFLTKTGEILVNEVAPRPHNSGHHTIESCYTSQYDQHLRAILNWPLGSTQAKTPAVMVNLLGAEGHTGPAYYQGLEDCLALPGVNIHLYGKVMTKPFRKMGHVTVLGDSVEAAMATARQVQDSISVIAIEGS
ncbi:5-(carboxyamino)imidazole ribonucleotide synthase [Flavilitoribacter nigricans]|uniref:N5-carboxyaminoimidazole ribonucleotide synthase n=1 Tax=Flavilitoribacter nigricans (strain ATCC 23147 / DSM 23189 / NBRC 102662 / NCIMB 1420 / SS-2) TaxID=1122177 RepID=A0A2D0NBF1_FLAN2|nr:5-(carboxyamino)imidazole ribonucleotide synthase [Flavilitoribacter nigricans]PHN05842.1 5-(carboxyamino)imidazole ribonucleotide synthase [Flavilitoribacter nigricans DSM 23189 = NBRC 102662]